MDRQEFERLRQLPDKLISGDIKFSVRKQGATAQEAADLVIENSAGLDARLTITVNPKVGSKVFNVHIKGVGPVCRLCVDGMSHRPAGRSHKHSLRTPECPDHNLPLEVQERQDLSGKPLRELFQIFCQMAQIKHDGVLVEP